MKFTSKKPHYEYLKKKWLARQHSIYNKFLEKHGDSLKHIPASNLFASRDDILKNYDQNILLAQVLSDKIPSALRPLNSLEEKDITDILSRNFGFRVRAEINNIRLNRDYGLIGGEQHLYRFPGDNLYAHADTTSDFAKYGEAGMAPALGAWGYFVPSKQEFSEIDKLRERYYLAVQTFLVPGYAENVDRYRDFFKFRKMLVVNPKTGQAVVAVIGDAGSSDWTGKHLGGSPEVIDALGLGEGPRKGPVLYFFIDDPGNTVFLGPIKVKNQA